VQVAGEAGEMKETAMGILDGMRRGLKWAGRVAAAAVLATGLWACGLTGPAATATPAATDSLSPVDLTMAAIATTVAVEAAQPTVTPLPATVPATLPATETPLPTTTPAPTEPPTPTALVEGLGTRLGTPDPSPNCPEHYPWFFENTAAECADFVLNTWTVWQPFEHGVMVWMQERGRTLVLVDDGSLFKPFHVVVDAQGLPFPEPDASIVPPEGLYQPERGFALFWRGLAAGSEWVRGALGWATAPESAYSGLWQCNRAQGDAAHCYFIGPGDEIVSLAVGDAAYWNYWQRTVR
jgi:hypothetical protein